MCRLEVSGGGLGGCGGGGSGKVGGGGGDSDDHGCGREFGGGRPIRFRKYAVGKDYLKGMANCVEEEAQETRIQHYCLLLQSC